jgi:monoamine oxidase
MVIAVPAPMRQFEWRFNARIRMRSKFGNHGMTISRRAVLSASAAFAAAPLFRAAAAPVSRDVDIVVIGAGAAGIAAARRVAAANHKVVVIEATDRIGGRCHTDASSFAQPFDRGARWLYNAESNPMVRLARRAGIALEPAPAGQRIRVGRRNARTGESEDFLATLVRARRAIDEAARGRNDVACAAALPNDLAGWASTVEFVLGASATGKDLAELSAQDKAHAQERIGAIGSRPGLGAMVTKLGEGLPVVLGTPATQIAWGRRDVSVETPVGRITARAAIVTVSTNVLHKETIRFAPALPFHQLEAAARLSLGSYDRIALQLSGNPLGVGRDEMIIEQSQDRRTALLLANLGGSSLCTIDVAGSFGRDLSAQGEAAMVAFAREWLTKLFGSDAVAHVQRSAATKWNAMPFVLGAMSAAAPGGQPSRQMLAQPFGNVFLAGEATHETLWGTVTGAWESGERAADAALKAVVSQPQTTAPRRHKKKRRH